MPMEEDPSLEAAQSERQRSHRIGMVDVDDVVLSRMFPKPLDHHRGDHGPCCFQAGWNDKDSSMLVQRDDLHFFRSIETGAEHIARDTLGGQALRQAPFHLFNTTSDRIEFTELQDSHTSVL